MYFIIIYYYYINYYIDVDKKQLRELVKKGIDEEKEQRKKEHQLSNDNVAPLTEEEAFLPPV